MIRDVNRAYNSECSYAPYLRTRTDTQSIMTDVCIALIPSSLFGIYYYGFRAFIIIIITVAACVGSELLYEMLLRKKITIQDRSALVTGLMLALCLPVSVPYVMPLLGGVFAIIVVKQLYGGLGRNIMNPALAARCFLHISFAGYMDSVDAVTGATPLAVLKNGGNPPLGRMFLGLIPGTIGETSVMAIMIGAVYLVYKKIITLEIPLAYITSFLICIVIYSLISGQTISIDYCMAHIFGGGLLFGVFFMSTDYVTSPVTFAGRCVYGIIAGVLTALFRVAGPGAEGVSYAILCADMTVPLMELMMTRRKEYGKI